ncbi:MAG: SGNH/GDSL hydrolase family protein [Nitrospinales bacterium]
MRIKRISFWVLYLVILFLFLEGTSYLVLRFFTNYDFKTPQLNIFTSESKILPFGLKPNFSQEITTKEFNVVYKMNNMGWREKEDYTGKKIDIGFVGDSFTFGWGVNWGERYSDLFRNYFPEKYIVSFGYADGWTTPHYYLFLKNNPQFVPKLLIMGILDSENGAKMLLGNDLTWDMDGTDFTYNEDGELISTRLLGVTVNEKGQLAGLHPPMYHFAVFFNTGKLMLVARRLIKVVFFKKDIVEKDIATNLSFNKGILNDLNKRGLEYILQVKNLLADGGSKLIVFIIPEAKSIVKNYGCDSTLEQCEDIRNNKYLQKSIGQWLTNHDIEYIDPTEQFQEISGQGEKLFFEQDDHWTKQGHILAAQIIYQYLENSKGLDLFNNHN